MVRRALGNPCCFIASCIPGTLPHLVWPLVQKTSLLIVCDVFSPGNKTEIGEGGEDGDQTKVGVMGTDGVVEWKEEI